MPSLNSGKFLQYMCYLVFDTLPMLNQDLASQQLNKAVIVIEYFHYNIEELQFYSIDSE